MKIFAVITVARQVEGEYCFVRTNKAFRQAGAADVLAKKLNEKEYRVGDKFKSMKLSTPNGDLECQCIAGAFELELED